MRKKILAANWKMNLTHSEAESYLRSFVTEIRDFSDVDVVIIPPFTAIPAALAASEKMQTIRTGAQNMHWEKSGAFTGEISATMLRALYVRYVVLGHSERRTLFGEADEIINRKVKAALDAGLRPIFCLGESLHERDSDQVKQVLETQIRKGLEGVSPLAFPPSKRVGGFVNAQQRRGADRFESKPKNARTMPEVSVRVTLLEKSPSPTAM